MKIKTKYINIKKILSLGAATIVFSSLAGCSFQNNNFTSVENEIATYGTLEDELCEDFQIVLSEIPEYTKYNPLFATSENYNCYLGYDVFNLENGVISPIDFFSTGNIKTKNKNRELTFSASYLRLFFLSLTNNEFCIPEISTSKYSFSKEIEQEIENTINRLADDSQSLIYLYEEDKEAFYETIKVYEAKIIIGNKNDLIEHHDYLIETLYGCKLSLIELENSINEKDMQKAETLRTIMNIINHEINLIKDYCQSKGWELNISINEKEFVNNLN